MIIDDVHCHFARALLLHFVEIGRITNEQCDEMMASVTESERRLDLCRFSRRPRLKGQPQCQK